MLTEKDYCDKETSEELEKLGYPKYHYDATENDKVFRLITLYAAQKWLREKKGIFVHISYPLRVENDVFWNYEVLDEAWDEGKQNPCICASGGLFDSYEEALLRGVRQAVNLLKENK
jgi:hypothetical protein